MNRGPGDAVKTGDGHIYVFPCAATSNPRSVLLLPLSLLPRLLHSSHYYRDGSQYADSGIPSYDLDYLDLVTLEESTSTCNLNC